MRPDNPMLVDLEPEEYGHVETVPPTITILDAFFQMNASGAGEWGYCNMFCLLHFDIIYII